MDSQDQRGALGRIVDVARKTTRIVQIFPFVYLGLVALYLVGCWAFGESLVSFADSILARSSFAPALLLVLSRVLNLCRWHKVACMLPSATKVETFIDSYLFQFTEIEIVIINAAIGIIFLLFIYRAIKHFFHDGRKRNHTANA